MWYFKDITWAVHKIILKAFGWSSNVGMAINIIVVKMLLTLVYVLAIIPYHAFMQGNKEKRWVILNKKYIKQDFIHMG